MCSATGDVAERGPGVSACGYRRQIAGVPNVDEVASASEMPRVSSLRTRPRDSSVAFGCPRASCSRSEEHTSELQSLMRISYAVFCLKKKKYKYKQRRTNRAKLYKHRRNQQIKQ